jgi:hypothetical protein
MSSGQKPNETGSEDVTSEARISSDPAHGVNSAPDDLVTINGPNVKSLKKCILSNNDIHI